LDQTILLLDATVRAQPEQHPQLRKLRLVDRAARAAEQTAYASSCGIAPGPTRFAGRAPISSRAGAVHLTTRRLSGLPGVPGGGRAGTRKVRAAASVVTRAALGHEPLTARPEHDTQPQDR